MLASWRLDPERVLQLARNILKAVKNKELTMLTIVRIVPPLMIRLEDGVFQSSFSSIFTSLLGSNQSPKCYFTSP